MGRTRRGNDSHPGDPACRPYRDDARRAPDQGWSRRVRRGIPPQGSERRIRAFVPCGTSGAPWGREAPRRRPRRRASSLPACPGPVARRPPGVHPAALGGAEGAGADTGREPWAQSRRRPSRGLRRVGPLFARRGQAWDPGVPWSAPGSGFRAGPL